MYIHALLAGMLVLWGSLCLTSCQSVDKQVGEVLDGLPASRRDTLSAFLSGFENDSKKTKGAKWIVANIENKYSIIGRGHRLPHRRIDDTSQFDSDLMAKHVDAAYKLWEQSPWHARYSSEYFLRYILPYRIADEPLEYDWRVQAFRHFENSLQTYRDSSITSACAYLYNQIDYETNNLFWGEPLQSYSGNARDKRGTCSDYALYVAMIMRSQGIPVTLDFVPYWGDNNNGHSFNALLLPDGSCRGFNNKEDLQTELHLSGKVPKIYRKEYAVQRNTALYKYRNKEFIPPLFAEHNVVDVTSCYNVPTSDVVIRGSLNKPESHLAYLSVFSPKGWRPVAWCEYKNNRAEFRNVGVGYTSHDNPSAKGENYGTGILFLPVSYAGMDDNALPLSYPFILKESGEVRYLVPDDADKETVMLKRKYPRKKRIIRFAERMVGGYFEMSNQSDFSQAQLVYLVDSIPQSGLQFIPVQSDKAYRYLRFYRRKNGISIGEMGALDGQGRLIKGTPIADGILQHDPALEHVNDGKVLSYIDINGIDDTWVGIDWGRSVVADKLFFSPRTDDNEVSVGDVYELFYWDKAWISLGQQTAQEQYLVYEGVPKNALLWLRNRSKGVEERPFTYDGGKQIWW